MKGVSFWRNPMWIVAFGTFVAADDLMVVSTMLRPIIDDVGLKLPEDLDSTSWIVNVYLIAYIVAMPLAGKLSDVYGRRAVFTTSMALFAIGSIIVPSTDRFDVLLLGRAISALGGGALVPVALAVAGDLYSGAKRTKALGTLGAIETLGWVWGPLYGALLVRFVSWEWQFYLNVPLAIAGIIAGWGALDPSRRGGRRIDWAGAVVLSIGLVALNVALLSQAKIQSAAGLEELRGGNDDPWWSGSWLYVVAVVAGIAFVTIERRLMAGDAAGGRDPIIGVGLLGGRGPIAAMVVNALVGVGLVIALVNVPLFINIVNSSDAVGSTALLAGALLTALTAAMALTAYLGGAATNRFGIVPVTLTGLALALVGFLLLGWTWTADTGPWVMAWQLAMTGAGVGLVLTPTSVAVVDAAAEHERGSAAGLVIVFRLIGFSIGLAALTAFGLYRYDVLRGKVELPPLGSDGYEQALGSAAIDVSTTALAETFLGSAVALGIGILVMAVTRPE